MIMTNRKILDIAMAQSAVDLNCRKEDFLKSEPVIALSAVSASARRYLKLPFDCNLVEATSSPLSCRSTGVLWKNI